MAQHGVMKNREAGEGAGKGKGAVGGRGSRYGATHPPTHLAVALGAYFEVRPFRLPLEQLQHHTTLVCLLFLAACVPSVCLW